MSGILVGYAGKSRVELDLEVLLRTRLLIQANSGGGKSWLIRRLAEQLFGKIPVLIIDPEGEFATLREKYGYVLVGKGGETPADTRSAALVAQRLLELRASAVCDLYEMKPGDRHRWVHLFLEALIDAPKSLWRPTVVMVDEAHTFCPEKGAGESEASDAMTSLPTRGRKRRFCAVWATQRLGKLRKDASAELLNRLIGPTFEDVDLKRAADLLSIRSEDRKAFDQQMRVLEPGSFYALGRAITKERVLVHVGGVATSHEIEQAKHGAEPPPPPERVKALLPKLSDLPRQAEEKARTEAELRGEIRSLRAQLTQAKRAQPAPTPSKTVEIPVVKPAELARLEKSIERLDAARDRMAQAQQVVVTEVGLLRQTIAKSHVRAPSPPPPATSLNTSASVPVGRQLAKRDSRAGQAADSGGLTGPEQRILDAIAWIESLGQPEADQAATAFLAGYTVGGGAWNNPRGRLHTRGLVEYRTGGRLALTEAGRALARAPVAPLTTEELHQRVLERLPGPECKILRVLLESYPAAIRNEDLAAKAGYAADGGAFNNPRGRLRSLGLIDYSGRGMVVARPLLFLEG